MARILPVDELVDERYEIRAVLEHAASFHAYRAFDREIDVEVSLWHMRDELFPDSSRRRAFVSSVGAMRSLRHPHLRSMFGAGDADGVLYATCQLETDDGLLPRPGDGDVLDDEALLHYATSVVDALDAAHQAGHVHGHLVPRDIVHVAGLIKVGGVGLYRDVDTTASRSVWVEVERFTAPEVLSGQAATPASDVFSLAVMIAELASGSSDDNVAVTVARLHETQPELADQLQACLAVAPERRPQGAPAFLERVADGLGYEPTTAEEMQPTVPPGGVVSAPGSSLGTGPAARAEGAAGPVSSAARFGGQLGNDAEELATVVEQARDTGAAVEGVPAAVRGPFAVAESGAGAGSVKEPLSAAPGAPVRAKPVMVSHKPKSEPGKIKPQRVAVIDRPDLQPVVRPLSTVRGGAPAAALGHYAPPRALNQAPAGTRKRRVALILVVVALLLGVAVGAFLMLRRGDSDAGSSDSAVANPGEAAGAPVAPTVPTVPTGPTPVVTSSREPSEPSAAGPCPSGMVLVSGGQEGPYCIDQYEAPGQGRMPESGLSFVQAEARCRSRRAQLCTPGNWEKACRGAHGASWPYGSSYRRGVCNVKSDRPIVATGTFRACRSAAGLLDMSGNVAEWVQGAVVRGGSVADRSDGRCSRVVRRAGSGAAAFADVGYRCCAAPRN